LCGGLLPQVAAAQPSVPDKTLAGINWGIGLAADFDIGGKRVANATVVNNIIRAIDTSNNVDVSFVLEAHYFFKARETGTKQSCTATDFNIFNCNIVATGPFVAIEIGSSNGNSSGSGAISGYALGWMVGFQHPGLNKTSESSTWNLGIGLRVDPRAQVLGDGLALNQPLPVGEPSNPLRVKTEPRLGIMLLSSFTF
jgi:hypothetical protein